MGFFESAWIVAKKDLALEFRGMEIITTGVFFAVITILILGFAFNLAEAGEKGRQFAAGALWVAIFFSGSLTMNRSFLYEKENDCLSAMMLAPMDRSAIYFGKMGANFLLMLVSEALIAPVAIVIFNVNIMERFFPQMAALFLGTLGLTAVGTLVAAMSVNLRIREVLAPLLGLPLLMPVIITAPEISSGLIGGVPLAQLEPSFNILIAFDVIYLVAPWLVFDKLIEQ